ncbi:MAG: hypothetical protein JXR43_03800 [Burkholderiaceae bacterium]|nr:hypothetical protein [Burkholderiaceae bacterium]
MSTSIRPSLSRALPALAVAAALVAPMPQALSAFSPIATAHAASCVCAPMHACAPASKHMQQTDRASTRPGP